MVVLYLLALSSDIILLNFTCTEQDGRRVWPPHLMRFLACLQSYGYSAIALFVLFQTARTGSRETCDAQGKTRIAFFKCIQVGLSMLRTIVIAMIVVKAISIPITFNLLPIRHATKIDRVHKYDIEKVWFAPLNAFVLLLLWATTVTNTKLLLKCNNLHMGHWDFRQVSKIATPRTHMQSTNISAEFIRHYQ